MVPNDEKSLTFPPESLTNTFPEVIYPQTAVPQHHRTRLLKDVKDMYLNTPEPEKPANFDELPPQLQAPNLTARLQAAMSSRPKPPSRNNSDSNLTFPRNNSSESNLSALNVKVI